MTGMEPILPWGMWIRKYGPEILHLGFAGAFAVTLLAVVMGWLPNYITHGQERIEKEQEVLQRNQVDIAAALNSHISTTAEVLDDYRKALKISIEMEQREHDMTLRMLRATCINAAKHPEDVNRCEQAVPEPSFMNEEWKSRRDSGIELTHPMKPMDTITLGMVPVAPPEQ